MADKVDTEKFLKLYGEVLVRTWGDEELKSRFKSDPGVVLKEFGLDPGGAKVTLKQPSQEPDPDICTPESQVKLWNQGLVDGEIQFYYPDEMPEGAEGQELGFEELEAVSGGGCCSCTPCCSCCWSL
jgi:hypothetical protein